MFALDTNSIDSSSVINQLEEPPAIPEGMKVEELPIFPGGDSALIRYISENVVYPRKARRRYVQGIVYCSFIVEKDGSVSNPSIVRGIGAGCDEETIRVIMSLPKFIPGKHSGYVVRTQMNIPVAFKLLE